MTPSAAFFTGGLEEPSLPLTLLSTARSSVPLAYPESHALTSASVLPFTLPSYSKAFPPVFAWLVFASPSATTRPFFAPLIVPSPPHCFVCFSLMVTKGKDFGLRQTWC